MRAPTGRERRQWRVDDLDSQSMLDKSRKFMKGGVGNNVRGAIGLAKSAFDDPGGTLQTAKEGLTNFAKDTLSPDPHRRGAGKSVEDVALTFLGQKDPETTGELMLPLLTGGPLGLMRPRPKKWFEPAPEPRRNVDSQGRRNFLQKLAMGSAATLAPIGTPKFQKMIPPPNVDDIWKGTLPPPPPERFKLYDDLDPHEGWGPGEWEAHEKYVRENDPWYNFEQKLQDRWRKKDPESYNKAQQVKAQQVKAQQGNMQPRGIGLHPLSESHRKGITFDNPYGP